MFERYKKMPKNVKHTEIKNHLRTSGVLSLKEKKIPNNKKNIQKIKYQIQFGVHRFIFSAKINSRQIWRFVVLSKRTILVPFVVQD